MRLNVFATKKDREQATQAFSRFLAKHEAERERQLDAEISKLKSAADVRRWQRRVRKNLSDILGEFPERTPLRPRTVGKIERRDLRVEKIIFESQPKYYVTANLYIPKDRPLPAPGVLVTCGHAEPGKGYRLYRDAGIGLARKGYVALVFDPTGQGERSECIDPKTRRHLVRRTVSQHHWTGKPCFLTGMTLAGYRTWDGIRCIDYMLTRKEIDADHIGVMGNSGGGAMTLLITAANERVAACAASHPGGRMENTHIRGRRPPDRLLYSLIAPRPCRIIVGDQSGEETGHRVKLNIMKPFYEAYGCPERLELVLVDGVHDLKRPKREASYEWLNRWFGREEEGSDEPVFRTISEQRLWCTRGGQVQLSIKGETMRSLNSARADRIAPQRTLPKSAATLKKQQAALVRRVAKRIGFQRTKTPLNATSMGTSRVPGATVERLLFESEPGMPIPGLLFTPSDADPMLPVVIYAGEHGKPATLTPGPVPLLLARRGCLVLAIDVRDTGETSLCPVEPRTKWRDYHPERWKHDCLAIRALAIGRSRCAMRVLDVVRAVDVLDERGTLADRAVAVVGEGRGGIWAMKAAAFDPRIAAVAAVRTLASYRLITDNVYYNQFEHFWVPGVLADYDVPDLPVLVAPRPLAILSPVDHMSRPLSERAIKKCFAHARGAYALLGRPDALVLARAAAGASVARTVVEFLRHAE